MKPSYVALVMKHRLAIQLAITNLKAEIVLQLKLYELAWLLALSLSHPAGLM